MTAVCWRLTPRMAVGRPAAILAVRQARATTSSMKASARQADVVFAPVMQSAAMRRLDQVLHAIAPKEVTVTLVGESGTGKEVLARRAHDLSPRRTGPLVPINCAAIPESLFESEFFGHERGAFTGASERVRGNVEAAQAGTLFLDEIGEIPLAMQAKLLRFLENRRFARRWL
jgi:transcriptional regulator with PAS, ATPase and Fis domain